MADAQFGGLDLAWDKMSWLSRSWLTRLLASAAIAVAHFAIALALGPTQAFDCIARGICVEDARRPTPEAGILDWPISALPSNGSHYFLGSSFPTYAMANAATVAILAWALLLLASRLRIFLPGNRARPA